MNAVCFSLQSHTHTHPYKMQRARSFSHTKWGVGFESIPPRPSPTTDPKLPSSSSFGIEIPPA